MKSFRVDTISRGTITEDNMCGVGNLRPPAGPSVCEVLTRLTQTELVQSVPLCMALRTQHRDTFHPQKYPSSSQCGIQRAAQQ